MTDRDTFVSISDGDQLNEGYFNGNYDGVKNVIDSTGVIGVPVGTVLSWLKSVTGVPTLPGGFVECNGQAISDADSPLNGQTLPDLNGNANILYGGTASGNTKSEDYLPNHNHGFGTLKFNNTNSGTGAQNASATGYTGLISGDTGNTTEGTAIDAYSVVWIVRIK